ncbi:hypothetical protein STPH1_2661 [Streptomyces sp. OM5714]|nr:hypothetical protein STPH1_2661 [Streptomyces sp. OM5714]
MVSSASSPSTEKPFCARNGAALADVVLAVVDSPSVVAVVFRDTVAGASPALHRREWHVTS